ncbi:hypothetical protein PM082_017917 [Marasmius tenuissimus]|nr:hypothetical protein PM082_017917 [Marasmius tenuissimus]
MLSFIVCVAVCEDPFYNIGGGQGTAIGVVRGKIDPYLQSSGNDIATCSPSAKTPCVCGVRTSVWAIAVDSLSADGWHEVETGIWRECRSVPDSL